MEKQENGLIPGERKIIQIHTHLIEHEERNTILVVALCDDGSIWNKYCDSIAAKITWDRIDNFTGKTLTPLQRYNDSTL